MRIVHCCNSCNENSVRGDCMEYIIGSDSDACCQCNLGNAENVAWEHSGCGTCVFGVFVHRAATDVNVYVIFMCPICTL